METTNGKGLKRLTLLDKDFKAMMHEKRILAQIALFVVDEFKGMSLEEVESLLVDPATGGIREWDRESTNHAGTVRYDLLACFASPKEPGGKIAVILNIEGQNKISDVREFADRMLYYAGRLISDQKGEMFQNDRYGDMAKVVCVWLLLHPRRCDEGLVASGSLKLSRESGPETDHFQETRLFKGVKISLVCVQNDFSVPLWKNIAGFVGVYLSLKMKKGEKIRLFEEGWGFTLNKDDAEAVEMFEGASEDFWNEAKAEGFAEGKQQGLSQGVAQGLLQGGRAKTAELALNLATRLHLSLSEALDILGVPVSERKTILALIAARK